MFAAVVGQSWAIAAHPYNLEVNGVDVIGMVRMDSIRLDMGAPGNNGSLAFVIEDAAAAVTVPAWAEVRFIEHGATRPVLWGGFVQSARMGPWATTGRWIEVVCVGYGILLDKKVVDAVGTMSGTIGPELVSLVNRHGGRISALLNISAPGVGDTYVPSVVNTVAHNNYWSWVTVGTLYSYQPTTSLPATLRGVLDQWIEQSGDFYLPHSDDWCQGAFTTYWVDGYARLHAHAEITASPTVAYDGNCPVAISESVGAGLVRAEAIELEYEDTDRFNRVYIAGETTSALISDTLTGVASTDTLSTTLDHGLAVNDRVEFSGLDGGDGLTEGYAYYVRTVPTSTSFTVSATSGGALKTFSVDIAAGTVNRLDYGGWGYVGAGADHRTGDLEELFATSASYTESRRLGIGSAVLARTGIEVRASASIVSATPLDIRPGQKITVSNTALGLSSQSYRITGVAIAWQSSTQRTYLVTFGRSRGRASAMSRSARATVATKPKVYMIPRPKVPLH